YAGVAYLVWLGIKAWRAPVAAHDAQSKRPAPPSFRAMYLTALGTGFSNPKLIIFAAALFPQFIDTARPLAPQLAILIASFAALEGLWSAIHALGGRSLSTCLAPASRRRIFNRVTGSIFVAFGAALLGSRV